MTVAEVFAKISNRQVTALMFHEQMADYFDFLNLHGYKRWHEYRYLDESIDMRLTHRYHINHYNMLVPNIESQDPRALPASWQGQNRMGVQNKHQLSVSAFEKWQEWESETKRFLADMYVALQQQKEIAGACFVVELLKAVDEELKLLERHLIELKEMSTDNMLLVQDDIHEHYKEKTMHVGEKLKM